jgi:hypothetical protein
MSPHVKKGEPSAIQFRQIAENLLNATAFHKKYAMILVSFALFTWHFLIYWNELYNIKDV